MITDGLIFPALLLGALGWVIPRLLFPVFPEGVGPLIRLGLLSTLLLLIASALTMLALYLARGMPPELAGDGGAVWYFLRLGAMSSILWAPVMVLTIASFPKRWKEVEW
ncbi:hypothetical protein AADZ90_001175 [Aestuariibius sp. 2305UL40-4]|uniref:hypothetical protein n=1 Tax=Aestuariibius violaceus TaxID=3234132 RepID=UPI00345EC90F